MIVIKLVLALSEEQCAFHLVPYLKFVSCTMLISFGQFGFVFWNLCIILFTFPIFTAADLNLLNLP